jgi:hypothetical protein
VNELNGAIRSDLQHLGLVASGGPEVRLLDGHGAGVGDLIVLRQVHHGAESGEHGRGLANSDTLEITAVDGGRLMARRVLDPDAAGQRQYTGAFEFPYAAESQLAYAVTGHRGQGRTVTSAIALFTGTESRKWGYPAMTRGRDRNDAIVFTRPPNRADPQPGTREAPELALARRMAAERAATGAPPEPGAAAAEDALMEALGVMSQVLERPEEDLAAVQWKAREARDADHLARLHAEWQDLAGAASRARYEAELRAALPEDLREIPLGGTATWLWRSLRAAEAAGLDSAQVLQDAIASRALAGARDIAAVVDARIRTSTAGLIPLVPRPWSEQVPDVADPALRAHLERRAQQMDARAQRLAAHVTQTAPAWAVAAAGPVPADAMERLEWQHRITPVAIYREIYGWEDEADPIGAEPTADTPDKRARWHGAFAALGPAAGLDMRNEPDSRLHLMMSTYANATRDAPRYVGRELRDARVAEREFGLSAARHAAEAEVAGRVGDEATAERHAAREASARAIAERARAMTARLGAYDELHRENEQATRWERHWPVAARAELMRRHGPDAVPEMRSAEPAPPDETERAAMWGIPARAPAAEAEHEPDGQEPDVPQWVKDLDDRGRKTREKLDERVSQKIPHPESHEHEDIASAWPGVAEPERDAILQPPKPEIEPAPEIAGRDAEPETPYTAAEAEAEAGG